jgi:hypothetical protein
MFRSSGQLEDNETLLLCVTVSLMAIAVLALIVEDTDTPPKVLNPGVAT